MQRLPVLGVTIAVALGVAAPVATAASRSQIISDCSDDGKLSGKYSPNELRDARNNIPTDVDEYTDCRDVLRRAELPEDGSGSGGGGGAGGGGGTGGTGGGAGSSGGSGAAATPGLPQGSDGRTLVGPKNRKDWDTLNSAIQGGTDPVTVGGETVKPGSAGAVPASAEAGLPSPLLVVLVLLGVAGAGAAALATRKRVLDRRPAH